MNNDAKYICRSFDSANATDMWTELELCGIGITDFRGRTCKEKPSINYHSVLVLLNGRLTWSSGELSGKLQKGQTLVMPAGIHVRREYPGNAEQLWFAMHNARRWKQLNEKGIWAHDSVHAEEMDWIVRRLIGWNATFAQRGGEAVLASLLELLVSYLDIELGINSASSTHTDIRVGNMLQAVSDQPEKNWTLKDLAGLVNLSPAGLHALCLRTENVSPLKLVTNVRMQNAKRLLRDTQYTIDHIATLVGYGSPYAFSNCFVRETGMRPGKYRALNQSFLE